MSKASQIVFVAVAASAIIYEIITGGIGHAVFMLALVTVYFAPTVIAAHRDIPNAGSVAVINLFLGWTFIGWVGRPGNGGCWQGKRKQRWAYRC